MGLAVEAIKFNHDPASAGVDAMNIRRNHAEAVAVPEWQRGVSVTAGDSPAAYAIRRTRRNTLTIKVRFRLIRGLRAFPPRLPRSVEIRAVSPGKPSRWPHPWPWPRSGNPLGDVAPRKVAFKSGDSGFVTMTLTGHPSSVRVANIRWDWQARLRPTDPWTTFATTRHRIYVVVDIPRAPWSEAPFDPANTQLPWTEVLDHACAWAFGATSADAAAGQVAEHVFALGPGTVTYDCPGGGGSHYTVWGSAFDCSAFLERLGGGPGNGQYVNCTDCATIVSTFANALGADLWQSRMGYSFHLNPVQGIGAAGCGLVCGSWTSFSYHEVAWKGGCTENDRVYDGCLRVNGSAAPDTCTGWIPVLPKDMLFGAVGAGEYRDRLSGTGAASCAAQPGTRQRRAIV